MPFQADSRAPVLNTSSPFASIERLDLKPTTGRAIIAHAALVLPNLTDKVIAQLVDIVVHLHNVFDGVLNRRLHILHVLTLL